MAIAGRLTMKLLTIGVGIPVGRAGAKAVERAWLALRPDAPAREPAEPGVHWGDAMAWAALSAAGVVAVDLLTRRGAEEVWRTLLGTEPPPRPPTKAQKKQQKAQEKAELTD